MKNSSSLRRALTLLLLAVGLCSGLAGCYEEHRRPVHHGYYDHRRDYRDDRYYDRGPGPRRSTVYYDAPGASVTVRRDRGYYY